MGNRKMDGMINRFLKNNGWSFMAKGRHSDFHSFHKEGCCSVDVGEDELVFVSDEGDFLHIPRNYYALVGALMEHRQIAINYKSEKLVI